VTDDSKVKGFDPGRGDFTDKIRHRLRAQIDPLPPFAATVFPLDGKEIGVVRVFESSDTPHLVIATGSIPVREPGGTRNVRDRSELIDLARRGEEARALAADRLRTLPYVQGQLDSGRVAQGEKVREIIVRAAPLTRPAGLADRVLSTSFGIAAQKIANDLFPEPPPPDPAYRMTDLLLAQRGFSATISQAGSHNRASVIVDAEGVLVGRLEYPRPPAPVRAALTPQSVEADLRSLLTAVVKLCSQLDAHGRAVCDLLFRGYEGVEFLHQRAGSRPIQDDEIEISGEITLPPDSEEIGQLARKWGNELARSTGLEVWQELIP
jgi:hypothetical protein